MPTKTARALTREEFEEIVSTIRDGFLGHRANDRVATLLTAQANLGLRIGDITKLKLEDIVWSYDRYHIEIKEQKTGKKRDFTVPTSIYEYLKAYADRHNLSKTDVLFDLTTRRVNQIIVDAADFCGFDSERISSHSFRKFFATQIYVNNDYNITLVQKLLQHSSPSITQRYIGIQQKEIETALESHVYIPGQTQPQTKKGKTLPPSRTQKDIDREKRKEMEKAKEIEGIKRQLKRLLGELETIGGD